MRRLMVAFVPFWALACGGAPTEPSGEQHGPEGGVESGESGTLYSPTDTAVETRSGVRLTVSYDAGAEGSITPARGHNQFGEQLWP